MPTGDDNGSLLSVSVPSESTTPPISIEKQCSQPSSASPVNTSSALVSSSAPASSAVKDVVVIRERSHHYSNQGASTFRVYTVVR